jgi:putative serine protease PepD
VVLSSDGQILTNNHVVAESVGDLVVSFTDGTTAPAEIIGTDPLTDLAVIQARGVSGLTTASLGTSGDVKVGQEVVAVGSPFGLESTVTSGIVSALDRPVNTGTTSDGQSAVFPAIQTDAAINPGNSGGALVDLDGEVVGINAAIRTAGSAMATAGSIGLGFAIPMDQARPIVEQLAAGEPATHARIGVSVSDASVSGGVTTTGALVGDVTAGSAAADAGLTEGDVITAVDGHPISGSDALVATVRKYRPGDEVTLTYRRGDTADEVTVTLDSDEGTPTT